MGLDEAVALPVVSTSLPTSHCLAITAPRNQSLLPNIPTTIRDMADYSGSARLQAIFESALQAYEKETGITLAQHPLAKQLESCHSIEDIIAIMQRQFEAVNDLQTNDRIMKAIKTTVSVLTPLSDAASLADAVGLVREKALISSFRCLTDLIDIIPTCESSTGWFWYPT